MSGRRREEYETVPAMTAGEVGQRRAALGISQQELADRLGIDRKTLSRWECGRRVPVPFLRLALIAIERGIDAVR